MVRKCREKTRIQITSQSKRMIMLPVSQPTEAAAQMLLSPKDATWLYRYVLLPVKSSPETRTGTCGSCSSLNSSPILLLLAQRRAISPSSRLLYEPKRRRTCASTSHIPRTLMPISAIALIPVS